MSDFDRVNAALKSGADPVMICSTCPWDRMCVRPPGMTSDDIERKIAEATAKDDAVARSGGSPLPIGGILAALTYSGKDSLGEMCPVFSLQLRSSDGRQVADGVKALMQGVRV